MNTKGLTTTCEEREEHSKIHIAMGWHRIRAIDRIPTITGSRSLHIFSSYFYTCQSTQTFARRFIDTCPRPNLDYVTKKWSDGMVCRYYPRQITQSQHGSWLGWGNWYQWCRILPRRGSYDVTWLCNRTLLLQIDIMMGSLVKIWVTTALRDLKLWGHTCSALEPCTLFYYC